MTSAADTSGVRSEYALRTTGLTKEFKRRGGTSVRALDNVAIDVAPGEFIVVLGPSGCGKTTLLRSIAGLNAPDSGEIILGDRVVFSKASGSFLPPERRDLSVVFQSYALWPQMTIRQNIAYPLRMRKVPKAQISERVERIIEQVGLAGLGEQYPAELSGGQQQRVSLARALVPEAKLILFDEPLSNVDAKVREQLRAQLVELHELFGYTALYITHDQVEAMELADRILVMREGRVEEFDQPTKLYRNPQTFYTADFVGRADSAVARRRGEPKEVPGTSLRIQEYETGLGVIKTVEHKRARRPQEVRLLWRFEDATIRNHVPELGAGTENSSNNLQGRVLSRRLIGRTAQYVVKVGQMAIHATGTASELVDTHTTVNISLPLSGIMVFDADTEGKLVCYVGPDGEQSSCWHEDRLTTVASLGTGGRRASQLKGAVPSAPHRRGES